MTASSKSRSSGYVFCASRPRGRGKAFFDPDIGREALREASEGGPPTGKPKKAKRKRFPAKRSGAFGVPRDRAARRALLLKLGVMNGMRREGARSAQTATVEAPAAETGPKAFEPGARGRAILNGVRIREEDLEAAGGTYSLEQVQELMLGVSRQAVEKRVAEGSLLAVPGPKNRRRYPVAQFNLDGSIVAGMRSVRDILPTTNPWSVLNFLVQPDPRLDGRTPIEAMRRGEIAIVLESARRVGEQGA